MTLRAGHGAGAGVPRVEVLPADELPPASPCAADRDSHGRFLPGNRTCRTAWQLARMRESWGLDRADPVVEPFVRWGRRYAAARRGELARAHGGELSAGVGAIVESAANALAASRYLGAKAAETGDPKLFGSAAALAEKARQHELAAWELASREAKARPATSAPFWLAADDSDDEQPASSQAGRGEPLPGQDDSQAVGADDARHASPSASDGGTR